MWVVKQAHCKAGLSCGHGACLVLVALLKPHLPNALMKNVWQFSRAGPCPGPLQAEGTSGRKETSLPVLLFLWQGMRQDQSYLVQAL